MKERIKGYIRDQIWIHTSSRVNSRVWDNVERTFWYQIAEQVNDKCCFKFRYYVWPQIVSPIANSARNHVIGHIEEEK